VDGKTGLLVDPADPVELADALEHLIRDADLRERMGQAARAHVEEQFSFPAFAARIGGFLAEATPRLAARAT
jgi:glycosyltransferase involved in cell wall biosynthesis